LIPLSCLTVATAWADDVASRWSFGSQLGFAQGKGDSEQLAGDLSTLSYDVSATFGDKSRIGWRVFTGYRFNDYLAVQVGYADLGKVESGLPGADHAFQSSDGGGVQTIRGVDVGMQLKMPLSERVSLEFRGGKYYWQSRTHTTDVWGDDYRASRRDSDVFFGAGMEVALLEEFSATLGWTRYDVAGEPVALWTIGTLFRFSMY
jgi:OOP family OmpA-OmpF porin